MVDVVIGGVYRVSKVSRGNSQYGEWMGVKLYDQNDKPNGASFFLSEVIPDLQEGNDIRIDSLVRARYKKKQFEGRWQDITDLTFKVTKVGDGNSGFAAGSFDTGDIGGQLPF